MAQALNTSITHLLHRANQVAADRFAQEIGDTGLTPRQLAVLVAVADNDGISQTGIVAVTGIDRSTLTEIMRRLVKRGQLARRRTKDDARAYNVTLTAEGRRVIASVSPVLAQVEAELLAPLPVKRRADLVAALGVLVDGAKADTT